MFEGDVVGCEGCSGDMYVREVTVIGCEKDNR